MRSAARIAGVVAGCFAGAVALAVALLVFWLHAPSSHVLSALRYLTVSGAASLGLGTVALLAASRWAPTLGVKIALASLFASAVAIVNVLVMPLLMFQKASDRTILVITLLYFFVLSLAFSALVATITTRRLAALHAGAALLAAGELSTRVTVQGADEVADLGRAFNRMSSDLERSFQRQQQLETSRRELVAAVSHDLRTPVASIRAMAEAMLDGVVQDAETSHEYVGRIRHESVRLAALIDDLFEVARIESGSLELRLARVPIGDLVTETVQALRARADEKGVDLQVDAEAGLPALALDAPRMERVFVNLVENAVRHTPAGGSVHVGVRHAGDDVEICVRDTGEGIALEDQERVFERFYRSEKSRSRHTGGAGLGLAIARGIVEAHHGSLQLRSAPGAGATFVVRLTEVDQAMGKFLPTTTTIRAL
jgi:signal transduction histidine kinase